MVFHQFGGLAEVYGRADIYPGALDGEIACTCALAYGAVDEVGGVALLALAQLSQQPVGE